MARSLIFVLCVGAGLAVCTSVFAESAGISGALAQPFRDLGILRQRPEDVLRHAAAAPYAMPSEAPGDSFYCAAVASEITSLDIALGSDIDVHVVRRSTAGRLASGAISNAIGDAVGLPYRGVIRRISGADRRDRDMRAAIQAGMVRRAFLKGLRMRDCSGEQHTLAPQMAAALQRSPLQAVSDVAPALTPTAPARPALAAPELIPVAHVSPAPVQAGLVLQPVADVRPAG